MSFSKQPRQVPWRDWDEWMYVYGKLFSAQKEDCLEAIEIVSMWKFRGKVPHSIEASALLLQMSIADKENRTLSELEIRLQYSLTVIRAVNGLVDAEQQGQFAESILMLAEKMGLPAWIVELRHDATHNELPSISLLRSAGRCLLEWFIANYWEVQANHLKELTAKILEIKTESPTAADPLVVVEELPGTPLDTSLSSDLASLQSSTLPEEDIQEAQIPRAKRDILDLASELVRGSSSTLLTSIIVPFFLEAAILSSVRDFQANPPENPLGCPVIGPSSELTEFWLTLFRTLQTLNSPIVSNIVLRLGSLAVDCVESKLRKGSKDKTTAICLVMIEKWLQLIAAEFVATVPFSARALPANLFLLSIVSNLKSSIASTRMNSIDDIEMQWDTLVGRILSTLQRFCGQGGREGTSTLGSQSHIHEDSTKAPAPTQSSKRSSQSVEKCELSTSKRRLVSIPTSLPLPSSWQRVSSEHKIWSAGYLDSQTIKCPLYKVKIVESDAGNS